MYGFIVNPASGNGRGQQVWNQLEEVLQHREVRYNVQYTSRLGEAEQFAFDWSIHSVEITVIVAVGGDGTVHEVANGIYRASSISHTSSSYKTKPLGYVPAGSGNDFARGHQIPMQPLLALDVILLKFPHVRRIDLLKINNRIAVNSVGVGIDGRVARLTNEASYKKLFNQLKLGRLSYVLTLIRVLLSYKTCSATIAIDGKISPISKLWFITAANIPFYGGGMKICPQANPESGHAELCIVSNVHRLEFIRVFPKVYKGTHIGHQAITFHQGTMFEIRTDQPQDIHMDGEMAGTSPATIEVLPAILSIIVPDSNHQAPVSLVP